MTAPAPTRVAFCSRCGRPAPIEARSLDPRHPFVRCRRVDAEGEERGCGTVAGTFDQAEAEAIIATRRRDRATARHDEHIRGRKRNAWCRTCETDPPPSRATVHRYTAIEARFKLAAHLEFSHADRSQLTDLYHRDLTAMVAHHRKLHDDALARP